MLLTSPDSLSRRDLLRILAGVACIPGYSFPKPTPRFRALIKPPRLYKGATVGLISPAGAVYEEDRVERAEATIKSLGLVPLRGRHILRQHGYLAGTDEERRADLEAMFTDPDVGAIVAMRGGWGSNRILDLIDYDLVQKHPKILMGFSDITSLLIALYARTGLVTFHGPVGISTWSDFSLSLLHPMLFDGATPQLGNSRDPSPGSLQSPQDLIRTIHPGRAQGRLIGGNLSVITSMIGSRYLPDWHNHILFLEETREEPYRIDRMMTQLKLAGVLDQISGLVFGQCTRCEAEEPARSLTLMQVLHDHIRPLGIPAWYGAMIGHIRDKFTLPIGVSVEIDARSGTIRLLETAVR